MQSVPFYEEEVAHSAALLPGQISILTEAFSNLRKYSSSKSLASLTLRLVGVNSELETAPVEKMDDWARVWSIAASTTDIVAKALQGSGYRSQDSIYTPIRHAALLPLTG